MSWTDDSGKLWDNVSYPLNAWPGDTHWDETKPLGLTATDATTHWTGGRVKGSIHIHFQAAFTDLIEMAILVNDVSVWSYRDENPLRPVDVDLTFDQDIFAFLKAVDGQGGDNAIRFRGSANAAAGLSNSVVTLNSLNVITTGTGAKGGSGVSFDIGPIWSAVKPFVPWVVLGGLGLFGLQVFLPVIIGFTRSLSGAFSGGYGGGGGYGQPPQGQGQVLVIR